MRIRFMALGLAAALAAAGISSCSSQVDLLVGASSPRLRQELSRLAAAYPRSRGLRITPAEKTSAPGATAIVIDWNFTADAKGPSLSSSSAKRPRDSAFATATAIELLVRDGAAWREAPLLWDTWGIAASPERLAPLGSGKTFAWKDRAAIGKARLPFLMAGGDPGVRQAFFWTSWKDFPSQGELAGIASGGADRRAPASLASFKTFATLGKNPAFDPYAFHYKLADADNLARNSPESPLFGSYSWQRGVPGKGRRDFRSLAYPLPNGYAMPIALLCGRVTGSGAAAVKARDFLSWLLSPKNQKALSEATGYMAVNFNAANLDPNALAARDAVLGAAFAVPIDPEPMPETAAASWDSLLGSILANPDKWERVLAERDTR